MLDNILSLISLSVFTALPSGDVVCWPPSPSAASDVYFAESTPLHEAVDAGNLALVHTLVTDPTTNVNAQRSPDGKTPLHIACRHDNLEMVQALLNAPGIDLTIGDRNGWTAAWLAKARNRQDIADYIEKFHS